METYNKLIQIMNERANLKSGGTIATTVSRGKSGEKLSMGKVGTSGSIILNGHNGMNPIT